MNVCQMVHPRMKVIHCVLCVYIVFTCTCRIEKCLHCGKVCLSLFLSLTLSLFLSSVPTSSPFLLSVFTEGVHLLTPLLQVTTHCHYPQYRGCPSVATSEGILYDGNIDPREGGECQITKEFR